MMMFFVVVLLAGCANAHTVEFFFTYFAYPDAQIRFDYRTVYTAEGFEYFTDRSRRQYMPTDVMSIGEQLVLTVVADYMNNFINEQEISYSVQCDDSEASIMHTVPTVETGPNTLGLLWENGVNITTGVNLLSSVPHMITMWQSDNKSILLRVSYNGVADMTCFVDTETVACENFTDWDNMRSPLNMENVYETYDSWIGLHYALALKLDQTARRWVDAGSWGNTTPASIPYVNATMRNFARGCKQLLKKIVQQRYSVNSGIGLENVKLWGVVAQTKDRIQESKNQKVKKHNLLLDCLKDLNSLYDDIVTTTINLCVIVFCEASFILCIYAMNKTLHKYRVG